MTRDFFVGNWLRQTAAAAMRYVIYFKEEITLKGSVRKA